MPRPKVVDRRRCIRACDGCKRRKERCDGLTPCSQCRKREIESTCVYSNIRFASANSHSVRANQSKRHDGASDKGDASVDSILDFSTGFGTESEAFDPSTSTAKSAPVPRLSRMLRDHKGKFIYIGDSASLSFLQTIRRLVNSSVGPCDLITDPRRHVFMERLPVVLDASTLANHEPRPDDLAEVLALTNYYFLAVSGTLDLFDPPAFADGISEWVKDSSRYDSSTAAHFYLVLAIGAKSRAQDPTDDQKAESYFRYGRQLAADLIDDPSVITVQVFAMVAWYLVIAYRRNAASMNLAVAIQAAYALGIHRHEANTAFAGEDGTTRERAWKSLRVCDLFLSASMGRPSTTSHIGYSELRRSPAKSASSNGSELRDRISSAMSRICLIFERILSEVYSKRAVSLELAASISKQHREWTTELPDMLRTDGREKPESYDVAHLTLYLGSSAVIMAYYYSIILLTRPFLTFRVCSYISTKGQLRDIRDGSSCSPGVTTYADACVTSAIKGIARAHDVVLYKGMPKRLPLIINSVFISALSLGLAYFGDYDQRGWPLDNALNQAVAVLRHFAADNPQAARCQQIIEFLGSAANQYRDVRDDTLLQFRSQHVSDVFGHVSGDGEPERLSASQLRNLFAMNNVPAPADPRKSQTDGEAPSSEMEIPTLQDFESLQESSMITTTGMLASTSMNEDGNPYWQPFIPGPLTDGFPSIMSPPTSSNYSFGEETPLFSIMNDYHSEF